MAWNSQRSICLWFLSTAIWKSYSKFVIYSKENTIQEKCNSTQLDRKEQQTIKMTKEGPTYKIEER